MVFSKITKESFSLLKKKNTTIAEKRNLPHFHYPKRNSSF